MQELWFLRSACHLMLFDIYTKFRKDSLNVFQVIEQTWVWHKQTDTHGKKMSPNPKGGRRDILSRINFPVLLDNPLLLYLWIDFKTVHLF